MSDSEDDEGQRSPPKVDFSQYEGHSLPQSTVEAITKQVDVFYNERVNMKSGGAGGRPTFKGGRSLAWWGENAGRLPVVAWVARHTLCVPASSASSERSFSKAGHILSIRRRRLTGAHVDQINFLSSNKDL